MFISCALICPNNTHDPIPLPDGVSVLIGRSKETRIIDVTCSRNQCKKLVETFMVNGVDYFVDLLTKMTVQVKSCKLNHILCTVQKATYRD